MAKQEQADWICPDTKCGNINFSRRAQCNKCGKSKPKRSILLNDKNNQIGKQLAEKSKGLFSPDDWQCRTCGNINWARRSTCNVCNTPRVNTLGNRTGYGGGFMEREEVVEYKEHVDSDNEYDEFGRKKKQFRGKHEMKSILQEAPASGKEQDNQEQDEEDEEDGDPSKYDVWDVSDDDNGVATGALSKNKTSSPSSSSSSKSSSRSSSSGDHSSSHGSSSGDSSSYRKSRIRRSRSRSPIASEKNSPGDARRARKQ